MARGHNSNKKVSNIKDRKGATERTSNQGQKVASGGSTITTYQGHRKGV